MNRVARFLSFAVALLAALAACGMGGVLAQTPQPETLSSIVQELEDHPEIQGPQWAARLDAPIVAASIADIRQNVPILVGLTESQNARQRGSALLLLYGIAVRQEKLPEALRERDLLAGDAIIVPYIPRLAPRLTDPSTPNRSLVFLLFQALTAVRPAPPALLDLALAVLQDPQSTLQTPDTTFKSMDQKAPSLGPQMLSILISADASFYRDPVTNFIEGRDSPAVQQAILTFLRRPDQTAESLSETVRIIALAQVQNPTVNAEIPHLLDSGDPAVQQAVLRHIAALTLTPGDFAKARSRVAQLAADPSTDPAVLKLAKTVLTCWSNDRHHDICPPLGS